jgi:GNAT superfamily N-acetyltransferase
MSGVSFRRAEAGDQRLVFEVFRASLWAYVRRAGVVGSEDEDDVEAAWRRQGPLMEHLGVTATEDWLAEDESGRVVGMARSIERHGHVQLTHFFVSPDVQAGGIGRSLLERAFPIGWGRHRSVIATLHPQALGLYLRFGVKGRGLGLALSKKPAEIEVPTTLRIEEVGPGRAAEGAIGAIDEQVLGFSRTVDIRFLLAERPAYLFWRGRKAVAYLFAGTGRVAGPAAALDRSDLPALIARQELLALAAGHEATSVGISTAAADTLSWALEHGYRIEPFYELLLSDAPTMKLDRYLMTQPPFIW